MVEMLKYVVSMMTKLN